MTTVLKPDLVTPALDSAPGGAILITEDVR